MTAKQYSDIEKLQMLLTHWLQHNKGHTAEYAKWVEVARRSGHSAAADYIEQALDQLAKADRAFAKALESVGPPSRGQEHQHHHHHD